MRETCRADKMTLRGPEGHEWWFAAQHRIHGEVASNHALPHEPRHECVRILEIRIFPRRAVQPERSSRRSGQRHVSSIAKRPGMQLRQERADPEADAEP